jgi:hypothetical protein
MLSGDELLFRTMEENARNNQELLALQITEQCLKLDQGRIVVRSTQIIRATQTTIKWAYNSGAIYGLVWPTGITVKHANNKHIFN